MLGQGGLLGAMGVVMLKSLRVTVPESSHFPHHPHRPHFLHTFSTLSTHFRPRRRLQPHEVAAGPVHAGPHPAPAPALPPPQQQRHRPPRRALPRLRRLRPRLCLCGRGGIGGCGCGGRGGRRRRWFLVWGPAQQPCRQRWRQQTWEPDGCSLSCQGLGRGGGGRAGGGGEDVAGCRGRGRGGGGGWGEGGEVCGAAARGTGLRSSGWQRQWHGRGRAWE